MWNTSLSFLLFFKAKKDVVINYYFLKSMPIIWVIIYIYKAINMAVVYIDSLKKKNDEHDLKSVKEF